MRKVVNKMRDNNKFYEPICIKLREWISYDENKPCSPYWKNPAEHDDYRKMHDRDCVLTGGNLCADTIFSLWLPLRSTIRRINPPEVIWQVGDMRNKVSFARSLLQGGNLEKLLPPELSITHTLSELFWYGLGRENVMLLPQRTLNSARGKKPYWDYMPVFLYEIFPQGNFSAAFPEKGAVTAWIHSQHLEMLFQGEHVERKNILDLSQSGRICCNLAPLSEDYEKSLASQEKMLRNYVEILKKRKQVLSASENAVITCG
jgi:hypothetical protein